MSTIGRKNSAKQYVCDVFKKIALIPPSMLSMIKITKRSRQIALDFVWFVFIMIVVGQLGSMLSILIAIWQGDDIKETWLQQANSGNLLTFSVAIIASSAYFVIKEFHGDLGIKRAHLKSPLILLSIVFGLCGALVSAGMTQSPDTLMTIEQLSLHWIIYGGSIILATCWWFVEELQGSVTELNEGVRANSNKMSSLTTPGEQKSNDNIKV